MCKKVDFSGVSLLIIAGGQSSRMKQDKRLIKIDGISLLESILNKASRENFDALYLCVEKKLDFIEKLADKYNVAVVTDEVKDAGPISGLCEGLRVIKTDWALAVSCDMPFFEFDIVASLMKERQNTKVVMFSHQPLAALYHKSLAELFRKALEDHQRKLQFVINQVSHKILETSFEIETFNVNKAADLRLARGRSVNLKRKVPVISIIAPSSGTGKTTFIRKLIPKLRDRGIRVGVVKSDAHGFNLDVEGKDSWHFQQAGAQSVAVVSPKGWLLIQNTDERVDFSHVSDKMDGVDLILTESRTHGTEPAISLYRNLGEPLISDEVAAIFTDKKIEDTSDILQFNLNDIEQAIDICIFLMGRKILNQDFKSRRVKAHSSHE